VDAQLVPDTFFLRLPSRTPRGLACMVRAGRRLIGKTTPRLNIALIESKQLIGVRRQVYKRR